MLNGGDQVRQLKTLFSSQILGKPFKEQFSDFIGYELWKFFFDKQNLSFQNCNLEDYLTKPEVIALIENKEG
jgi:hypothetical protein